MKKAQTEMIGLVIIVVLLLIAGLFYIRFAFSAKPQQDTSLELQKAFFIANALSKVEICNGNGLQEIIAYCDLGEEVCGKNACSLIKQEIPKIIKLAFAGDIDVGTGKEGEKAFSFYVLKKDVKIAEVGVCYGKEGVDGRYAFKSEISGKDYTVVYRAC